MTKQIKSITINLWVLNDLNKMINSYIKKQKNKKTKNKKEEEKDDKGRKHTWRGVWKVKTKEKEWKLYINCLEINERSKKKKKNLKIG